MGLPAALAPAIGRNNAVPTRGVTAADAAQIAQIADWYVASRIIPRRPDIEAGVLRLAAPEYPVVPRRRHSPVAGKRQGTSRQH